jgi:hypothetical protein
VPINHLSLSIGAPTPKQSADIAEVDGIAAEFHAALVSVSNEIESVHRWRAKSDDIQSLFFPWLCERFKVSLESVEGFEGTTTSRNRPDAQIWLDEAGTRRVLVEVERGGTVTNNHDLKDLWKAHLSPLTQHLFLVVPNSIEDERGNPRSDQAFLRCSARLQSFFINRRTEVDVWSVHLFGYGPSPAPRSKRSTSGGSSELASRAQTLDASDFEHERRSGTSFTTTSAPIAESLFYPDMLAQRFAQRGGKQG